MCIRDRWWSSVAPAIGVDRDFPPWRPTLAQASSDVVRLRVALAELRAQNAELRLTCQLLGERTEALVERDQRHAAENAALRERNRLLSEEVAELRRRVDQNSRNSHRPPSSEGYAKRAPRPRRPLGVALARRRPMRVARVLVHPPAQLGDLLAQQPVALAQRRVLRRVPLVAFDQRLGALTEQLAGQSQLRVLGAQLRQRDAQPNNIGACLRQRRPPRGEVAVHTDRRRDRGPPLWRSTVTDQGNTPSGLKNQVSSYPARYYSSLRAADVENYTHAVQHRHRMRLNDVWFGR